MPPKSSEGVRRFSIMLGFVALISWIIFIFVVSDGFSNAKEIAWVVFFVGCGLCFLVGWGIVKSIYWVYSGFASDKDARAQGSPINARVNLGKGNPPRPDN